MNNPLIVFRNTLIVITTIGGVYFLVLSSNIIVVLVIAIILASAIRPMVLRLEKLHVPQGFAIALVYATLATLFIGLAVLVLPPLVNEFASYLRDENRLASRIVFAQYVVGEFMNDTTGLDMPTASQEVIRTGISDFLDQLTTSAPGMIQRIAGGLSEAVLALVMGVYWLTTRDRAMRFFVELFPPQRRTLITQIFSEIEEGMGVYLRNIVFVSALVGGLNFVILRLLDVTNAATLAFVMGVATAIPIVGGFLGVLLITLFALLASPVEALLVFITAAGVQQFENYVLTPRMMAKGVGFDTLLVFLFVAAGFTINGIVGALVAVPIAGAIYVLAKHLIIEPRRAEVKNPEHVEGGILLGEKDGNSQDTKLELAEKP